MRIILLAVTASVICLVQAQQKPRKVDFYPCKTSVLREVHFVGGAPERERKWQGHLDLNGLVSAQERVIITLIFDFPNNLSIVSVTDLGYRKSLFINFIHFF